ncbi:MAG: aldo/keto reductase [Microscillaceae bacterium]|nr:aldo/keto reductase [Microscillaceae bacterium]MDW8461212.1 aldo/keto reductase [Cytophagales bacterium]
MNYKLLGSTGLRVSELCLGAMTFGTEWGTGADYEESKKIFDLFAQQGGNFIDTANRYTEGTSEKFLADFIAHDRDYFVIATKYSLLEKRGDVNAAGNQRKNMIRTLEASLKRLRTDYIDLFWVHAWDFMTPAEEVMRGLDDLVRAGKVHYVGISDAPAWVVAHCNTLAQARSWAKFEALQIEYSLIERTVERDLIPMAKYFGLAIMPWSPLGAGILTGKYNQGFPTEKVRLSEKSVKYNARNLEIARLVSQVAQELGYTPTQVALAWILQKGYHFIPILGARTAEQLQDALGCLHVKLPTEAIQLLDEKSAVPLGFPHQFLRGEVVRDLLTAGMEAKIIKRPENY